MHVSWIFGLASVEEVRCRSASSRSKIGHLERVKIRILRVGNLGLAAETNIAHRNAMRGIDVCANYQRPGFCQRIVGAQDIAGRANFATAKSIFRYPEQQ